MDNQGNWHIFTFVLYNSGAAAQAKSQGCSQLHLNVVFKDQVEPQPVVNLSLLLCNLNTWRSVCRKTHTFPPYLNTAHNEVLLSLHGAAHVLPPEPWQTWQCVVCCPPASHSSGLTDKVWKQDNKAQLLCFTAPRLYVPGWSGKAQGWSPHVLSSQYRV